MGRGGVAGRGFFVGVRSFARSSFVWVRLISVALTTLYNPTRPQHGPTAPAYSSRAPPQAFTEQPRGPLEHSRALSGSHKEVLYDQPKASGMGPRTGPNPTSGWVPNPTSDWVPNPTSGWGQNK